MEQRIKSFMWFIIGLVAFIALNQKGITKTYGEAVMGFCFLSGIFITARWLFTGRTSFVHITSCIILFISMFLMDGSTTLQKNIKTYLTPTEKYNAEEYKQQARDRAEAYHIMYITKRGMEKWIGWLDWKYWSNEMDGSDWARRRNLIQANPQKDEDWFELVAKHGAPTMSFASMRDQYRNPNYLERDRQ